MSELADGELANAESAEAGFVMDGPEVAVEAKV